MCFRVGWLFSDDFICRMISAVGLIENNSVILVASMLISPLMVSFNPPSPSLLCEIYCTVILISSTCSLLTFDDKFACGGGITP